MDQQQPTSPQNLLDDDEEQHIGKQPKQHQDRYQNNEYYDFMFQQKPGLAYFEPYKQQQQQHDYYNNIVMSGKMFFIIDFIIPGIQKIFSNLCIKVRLITFSSKGNFARK